MTIIDRRNPMEKAREPNPFVKPEEQKPPPRIPPHPQDFLPRAPGKEEDKLHAILTILVSIDLRLAALEAVSHEPPPGFVRLHKPEDDLKNLSEVDMTRLATAMTKESLRRFSEEQARQKRPEPDPEP